MEKVWLRLGLSDEYVDYDTISAAVFDGLPFDLCGQVCYRKNGFVLIGTEYVDENYVSMYWGDEKGTPTRELTEKELLAVSRALKEPRGRRRAG